MMFVQLNTLPHINVINSLTWTHKYKVEKNLITCLSMVFVKYITQINKQMEKIDAFILLLQCYSYEPVYYLFLFIYLALQHACK